MIGIILVGIDAILRELGLSIGKFEVSHNKEPRAVLGFLTMFWSIIFFAIIGYIKQDFLFNPDSIPTLIVRIILEIAECHIGIFALVKASRSAVAFITTGTIPLLLIVDHFLGYNISTLQLLGILVVVIGLITLLINHGINKKGLGFVIFITLNAVATLSLYKYNIENFNSVTAEQIIVMSSVLVYFLLLSLIKDKRNPILYMKKPIFFIQSMAIGLGSVFGSFAYMFGAPSVITTAKRSFGLIFAMISGNLYFKEKKLVIKITAFAIILVGLVLLSQ